MLEEVAQTRHEWPVRLDQQVIDAVPLQLITDPILIEPPRPAPNNKRGAGLGLAAADEAHTVKSILGRVPDLEHHGVMLLHEPAQGGQVRGS